jgi:hypothetical protein
MKHKAQHTVPQCYMKAFISETRPPEYADNKHFKLGVWVNNKDLSSRWQMKAPKNILAKPYYYNLPGDDADTPLIEAALNAVESVYPPLLKKIEGGEVLSEEERQALAFFVSTLLMRTEQQQGHWGGQLKELERINRMVERVYTGGETASDELAERLLHTPKLFIFQHPVTGILLEHGMHFIINETNTQFITSDAPVIHYRAHIDEVGVLRTLGDCLDTSVTRNVQDHVIFLPLSPRTMLASSPFIRGSYPGAPYLRCSDADVVMSFNLVACMEAHEIVIANVDRPFGDIEGRFNQLVEAVRDQASQPLTGTWLLIYTNKNRHLLPVTGVERSTFSLRFRTEDLKTLARIAADGELERLEYRENGMLGGSMRQIAFETIDLTGREPSVIVNRFI